MTALVLVLLFSFQAGKKRDTVGDALDFLARHQRADGSWGERPGNCACPPEEPGAVDDATVAGLLRNLVGDDPVERESAKTSLQRLGQAALPHLRKAAGDPDPEVRAFCGPLLKRLELATPGAGDAELTGLALLTFLGAGYSTRSRDLRAGRSNGLIVQSGLDWLRKRQKETGAFDRDPVADTIAALALSEASAMGDVPSWKDEIQAAVDRVAGWEMKESRGLVWKGMALKSAEMSQLTVDQDVAEKNLEALLPRKGDLATAGFTLVSIFVHRAKGDGRVAEVGTLDPSRLETETLYFGDLATFQYDGPSGPLWKAWRKPLKARVLPAQHAAKEACERGSWDGQGYRGRVRGTALDALMFELYYATASVWGDD